MNLELVKLGVKCIFPDYEFKVTSNEDDDQFFLEVSVDGEVMKFAGSDKINITNLSPKEIQDRVITYLVVNVSQLLSEKKESYERD